MDAAFAATVMGICSVPLANAQEVAGMFGKGRLHGIVTAGTARRSATTTPYSAPA